MGSSWISQRLNRACVREFLKQIGQVAYILSQGTQAWRAHCISGLQFCPSKVTSRHWNLGFLTQAHFGSVPSSLDNFLPFDHGPYGWHKKRLKVPMEGNIRAHTLFFRSLYGYIIVYNMLHQSIVDIGTVKEFQRELTRVARARCENGADDWQASFHSESDFWKTRIDLQLWLLANSDTFRIWWNYHGPECS